jgi:hypothetical protein
LEPPEDSGEVEEDDYIVPERIHPSMCSFVRVQPHTSDHLPSVEDGAVAMPPEDILSRAFEEYTCIQQGQTLSLHLPTGSVMFVTIVEAQPSSEGPLCIRNTEIEMDLLAPLDAPEPELEPEPPQAPEPPQVPEPRPHETREERRALLAAAAEARAAKQKQNQASL